MQYCDAIVRLCKYNQLKMCICADMKDIRCTLTLMQMWVATYRSLCVLLMIGGEYLDGLSVNYGISNSIVI
jgi:hypothetical protein